MNRGRPSVLVGTPLTWLPILLSVAALGLVAGYVAGHPVPAATGDEGAPARIFQALLLADGIGIVAFGARRIPRAPKSAAAIVALQVGLAAVPVMLVLVLESAV